MKPILIRKLSTLKRFGADIVLKDNRQCAFLTGAVIKDSGNPFLDLIHISGNDLYIPRTIFAVEKEGNVIKICPINLLKLGSDHPLLKKITSDVYKYYANGFSTMDVVRSTGIPHQLLAEVMKCCPFLTKRWYKSLERLDIPIDELLEAYKNDKLEDLAVKYHTTVQEVLGLLLRYFKRQKRRMLSALNTCVIYKMKKGDHVYLYVPSRSPDGKSLKYIGREDRVADSVSQEIASKRSDIERKIAEIDDEISQIKHKIKLKNQDNYQVVDQYG